uniref:DNA-directed RNA polymerase subunit beta n=1 Tax=Oryza glumipatula TaxID=40148 RepID=A0A0D9Z8N5_9ORYZ
MFCCISTVPPFPLFFWLLSFRYAPPPPPPPPPPPSHSHSHSHPIQSAAVTTVAAAVDDDMERTEEGEAPAAKDPNASLPSPTYRSLAAPVTKPVDKFALLPAFLKVRGLVKEHIDSFNYFITKGIRNIVKANNRIEARNNPSIFLRYNSVRVGVPSVQVQYIAEKITPHFCRLTDRTYSAPVLADIEYTVGKQYELKRKPNFIIGYLPIMLRSHACVLNGKDEAELARYGECPLDPGGYFIVKGTEKVILIQEQLSKNRIIIDTDSKGRVIASVTSSTHEIKSKTVIFMEKEKIYLQLNQFTKPIPIIVVMKAMGMESDQEVAQMVGRDPRYGDLLYPSIQECAFERIYTQKQALQYMDDKVMYPGAGNQKEGRSKSILRDVFVAHVPVESGNFRPKCIYTAVMLRRMMDAILNADTFDDKDYVGNKRLELSGQLISLLFEDLFKTMNSNAVELMNKTSEKIHSSPLDLSLHIKENIITHGLERAISTGNWDIKRFRMHRKGVSQVLSRLSYMASLGYMTRITPQFEKTRKTSGPRALQPSQCYSLGVEDLSLLSGEEIHASGSFLVMFNGLILGKHRQPQRFANAMRKLRRSGIIGEFVSIFVNEKQDGIRSFDDFLRDGLIEYLDVNEENNALLFRADSLLYLLVYAQRPLLTTKTIELVGYDKLGAGQNATVAVMSYSGYDIEDAIVMNKSSLDRGFGRCIAMKKYTVTKEKYEGGYSDRIVKPQRDKDGVLLKQNMRALDEDGFAAPGLIIRNHDIYVNKQTPRNTKRDSGAHLTDRDYKDSPAVYKGVDGETTVVDRVMLCSDTDEKLIIKCIIRHTRRPEVGDKFSSRHGQKGVCGTIVQQEDFPFSERGICPDLIMNPHGFPRCKINLSKRFFQPYINNTSSRVEGYTGKMIELLGGKAGVSCGQFHYGSAFGEPSGNADKVEDISRTLVKHGFSYNGKDLLYSDRYFKTVPKSLFCLSGILGHPCQAYVFMGPIYYQKLKHMVLDKMHARASGPRVLLTRQPTEGRSRDGGLRLGEMERDCLIAYGASMLIFERLLISSDPYQVQVCRKCGLLGYYNHKLKASYCSMCKNGENMAKMRMPYACKLLFQELQAMNVVPRLKLTEG